MLVDVETAILTGEIVRTDTGDVRGRVYVLEGVGSDRRAHVGVVVRFNEHENVLVITAYAINK